MLRLWTGQDHRARANSVNRLSFDERRLLSMARQYVARRGDDIIFGSFRLHATGLTPIGKPTVAEWLACGRFLHQMEKHVHFWIGDWLLYGDVHFKEEYQNLEELTGYSYHTLRRDKY